MCNRFGLRIEVEMCLRVKVVCWRGWMGYFEENEEKWERGGGGVMDDGWWSRKCKVLIKRKWGQLWRGWRVEVHVAQMANLCRCDIWQREREKEREQWSFWTDCWTQSWNKCAGADFPRARVMCRAQVSTGGSSWWATPWRYGKKLLMISEQQASCQERASWMQWWWRGWQMRSGNSVRGLWCLQITYSDL